MAALTSQLGRARFGVPGGFLLALAAGFCFTFVALPESGQANKNRLSKPLAFHVFQEGHVDEGVLQSGWAEPDRAGVWSVAQRADLDLAVDVPHSNDVGVSLQFSPARLPNGQHQSIEVSVNGMTVRAWKIDDGKQKVVREVAVPRAVWDLAKPVRVSLHFSDHRSPAELATAPDAGRRGIHLRHLSISTLY